MGLRRIAVRTTTDPFRTVSLSDTAIDKAESDLERFQKDRSDIGALKLIAPPPGEPWESAVFFDIRPLTEHEVAFVMNASDSEAVALGGQDAADGATYTMLSWYFRVGCVGWENLYRHPNDDEGTDPVEVAFRATGTGRRQAVDDSVLRFVPPEVKIDLGSLILRMSELSAREAKSSGSQEETPSNSNSSESNATSLEAESTPEPAPSTPSSGESWDATDLSSGSA